MSRSRGRGVRRYVKLCARFDASTFAIFDAFNDEKGRQAHLAARLAAALMAKAPDLLAKPQQVDVIAARVQP